MSVQSLESQSESWTLALAKCWPLQKNLVNLALLFDAHSFKVWPPSCLGMNASLPIKDLPTSLGPRVIGQPKRARVRAGFGVLSSGLQLQSRN